MRSFQTFFACAFVVFVLLFSIAFQPEAAMARKRCPAEIPDSLLTLYLKSDLIVVGSIQSEKVLKKTQEYDYGSSFEVEKNLSVSETLKGREANSAAFVVSQFKSKNADENTEENENYRVNLNEKALFFLVKNDENNFYELADYSSAMKQLNAADIQIYAERIEELKRITTAKKNQLPKLAEWLVRLAEEPVTRGEGTLDLGASFDALEYERENEESNEEAAAVKEPIVLDKDFRAAGAPEIARLLTAAQKQRLSGALLDSISEDLLKIKGAKAEDEEETSPDYGFIRLVGHWDKTYLSMASFAFLQNTGDSNPRKTSYLMSVIADFLGDEELYEISGNYESALSQSDSETTAYTEEEKVAAVEDSAETEAVSETEKPTAQEPAVQGIEEIPVVDDAPKTSEAVEKPAAEITFKEYREKLLAKFTKQYGIAISQSSASN